MNLRRRHDPALVALLTGVPWWSPLVAAAVTLILLFTWNLTGLPLARGLFSYWYVWSLLVAMFFLAGWWRGHERRELLEQTQDLEVLRAMPWRDFELLVGEAYRRLGYQVTERGGGGADGGVDLELRRDRERLLVQCKRWKQMLVKVQPVRELWGVVSHEGAVGAIFVTSGRFTQDALDFAQGKRYLLVDGEQLLKLAESVRRPAPVTPVAPPAAGEVPVPARLSGATAVPTTTAPTCPGCGAAMIRRAGTMGRRDFWGCSRFPNCRRIVPIAG